MPLQLKLLSVYLIIIAVVNLPHGTFNFIKRFAGML